MSDNTNLTDLTKSTGKADREFNHLESTSFATNKINTEQGFISGLQTEYQSASQVAIQPGQCIADEDDETVITVDATLTADITTTGAGGRQSGLSEQASEWYEIYAVADSDGSNPAAFLVAEQQTFSNPKAVSRSVGWVRNDSTSDFDEFFHAGLERTYFRSESDHAELDTSSPATTATTVSLAPSAPPGADAAIIKVIGFGDGATSDKSRFRVWRPGKSNYSATTAGWAAHGVDDATNGDMVVVVNANREVNYDTYNAGRIIIRVQGYIVRR